MVFSVSNYLNRMIQLPVNSAETGNSYVAVDIKIDPSQQLMIYGVDWGYSILLTADQTNFVQGLRAGYLDMSIDFSVGSFFSRSNPLNDNGQLLDADIIGSEANFFYSRDYANPLIIQGSHRTTVVVVQPLFSAPQGGSIIMYLRVRGDYKPNAQQKIGDWNTR